MKILIVDDESLAIKRLEFLLKSFPEVTSIDSARSATEAVFKITHLKPDLVLIDVEIGNVTGYEVIEQVDQSGFRPKYIVVTAFSQYAIAGIRSQVDDYLLKPVDLSELKASIDRIDSRKDKKSLQQTTNGRHNLTAREGMVLDGMLAGKTSREIAADLNLSPKTVDTFRRKILKKMGASNTIQLIMANKGR